MAYFSVPNKQPSYTLLANKSEHTDECICKYIVLPASLYSPHFRIVRQIISETYENEDYFDITFIILIWIAFLPTIVVQWFVAHWLLIGGNTTNLNRTSSTRASNRTGNYDNIHQDSSNTTPGYTHCSKIRKTSAILGSHIIYLKG